MRGGIGEIVTDTMTMELLTGVTVQDGHYLVERKRVNALPVSNSDVNPAQASDELHGKALYKSLRYIAARRTACTLTIEDSSGPDSTPKRHRRPTLPEQKDDLEKQRRLRRQQVRRANDKNLPRKGSSGKACGVEDQCPSVQRGDNGVMASPAEEEDYPLVENSPGTELYLKHI